jgi:hypothetical protein
VSSGSVPVVCCPVNPRLHNLRGRVAMRSGKQLMTNVISTDLAPTLILPLVEPLMGKLHLVGRSIV